MRLTAAFKSLRGKRRKKEERRKELRFLKHLLCAKPFVDRPARVVPEESQGLHGPQLGLKVRAAGRGCLRLAPAAKGRGQARVRWKTKASWVGLD